MASKIKKGDNVVVIAGAAKGTTGTVSRVIPEFGQVIVEGVNRVKRHMKPTPRMPEGGIVEKWPDAPAGLAAGRLDLDHVGSKIAEQLAAELAGFVREFEDSEAGERAWQSFGRIHPSISSIYGKRARLTGQNVPSAKPARRSSWL